MILLIDNYDSFTYTRLAIESHTVSHSFYDALAKDGLSI